MVGGFNTNVRYRGRVFHVQTEVSGDGSPSIVTLLYEGGAILYSKKQGYEGGAGPEVRELMEWQHRETVRHLKGAGYDDLLGLGAGTTEPRVGAAARSQAEEFGQGIISDRPLDEVIVAHLAA